MHIDSYKKIKYIDGYKINLINFEKDKIDEKQLVKKNKAKKNLWFVNIGGSTTQGIGRGLEQVQELHHG